VRELFASPVKAAAEPSSLPPHGRRTPASPSPRAHACLLCILAPDTPPTGARAVVPSSSPRELRVSPTGHLAVDCRALDPSASHLPHPHAGLPDTMYRHAVSPCRLPRNSPPAATASLRLSPSSAQPRSEQRPSPYLSPCTPPAPPFSPFEPTPSEIAGIAESTTARHNPPLQANSQATLHHSPIHPATSSSGRPRTHFAP